MPGVAEPSRTSRQSRGSRAPSAWVRALLQWFACNRRAMPWRDRPTPYAVWVSEVMLQQTQVGTVMPYFERFVCTFPDVHALAAAPEQAVLKCWEGLGYYSRARNLQRAARQIVNELDGRIPSTCAGLLALPGIGEYAAAAIASIAYGEAVPAVDGNVLRVIARLRGIEDDIMLPATRRRVRAYLQPYARRVDPNAFNQSLMELGALVCRPRRPCCAVCPLARACVARRRGLTERIPVKSRATSGPAIAMVAGLMRSRGRLLLSRRPPTGLLGGLWELPAGPLPAAAAPADAASRVLRKATGLTVEIAGGPRTLRHTFSHFRLTLHVFQARRLSGRLQGGPDSAALRWIRPAELADLPLTKTTRDALRQ